MAFVHIMYAELKSQDTHWKGLSTKDTWLAPNWTKFLLGGMIGKLVQKCKKVAQTLEWEENERYFENFAFNVLPCYPAKD